MKKYISGLFLVLILSSCATEAPKKDVFVLTELLPMRVDKPETEVEEEVEVEIIEVEPEFLYGVIVEIEVQRGEQKYVYVKTENEAVGLPKGTEGEICEDESWAKQVGKFKIIEEYPGYYYAELVELFYTVRIEQPVRIEKKK